jgi:O-antigen/teichoic acid export membrane protein
VFDEPAESTGSRNQFSFDARVEGPNDARIVFSAVRWTGISQIVNQTIRMIISVILARLLSPEDFGMLAMASVVSGFFMVLQYFGAGGVVVQRKNITQRLVSSLFMLNIGLSTILFTALLAIAPLLASIYHSPQLVPIIRALGIGSVFTVVASIPTAILNRRLRFDQLALISFFGSLTQGVVAITLAALGFKVWALVYANIATSIVSVVSTWWLAGWRPQMLFHWGDIKEVLDYCLHQAGTGFINYFVDDSDKFILGKWLGDRNLGFYTGRTVLPVSVADNFTDSQSRPVSRLCADSR